MNENQKITSKVEQTMGKLLLTNLQLETQVELLQLALDAASKELQALKQPPEPSERT